MKSTMDYGQFAGQSLLEVGFGMGTDLFQFASGGAIVSGIDLTPRHYEIASRRFQLYDIPADLRLGDAENMPYEDESFDAVYTFGVIHHSPNTEKIVDEIYRVLKPGGTAIIAVYYKWSIFYLIQVILSNHIISGGFLREPFRKTMARIEHRENEDAWPLVKVYSRRQMRSMLKKFAAVSFKVRHLGRGEFGYFRRFVPPSLPAKLETKMGWFLIAKCVK
jgi:ubiquinone/menaquinone biosynthesis C-methylase UbiE